MGRKSINSTGIIALYHQGLSVEDIAERVQCSPFTVRNHLGRAKLPVRHHIDKGKILALRTAEWKISDISWDVGCSEDEVREVLNGCSRIS